MVKISEWIYKIVDGELQQIAEGYRFIEYLLVDEGAVEEAVWNDIAVTEEEYCALQKEAFDETKAGYQIGMENVFEALTFLQDLK